MKLRTQFLLLAAVTLSFIFASCSKTNEQGKLVPNDAAIVMHINGQSLSSKLPWEEIKANPLFQKMYADSTIPAFVKNILDNPENSGINIKSDFIFFAKQDTSGSLAAFEGSVKDTEKFKLFNQEATKGGSETEKGGLHFISRSPACVGWNKDRFVYVFSTPDFRKRSGTNTMTDQTKPIDLLAACKAIFDLPAKNSLGSNEKFTALMKKAGDFHIWINTEEITKSAQSMAALSMLKMDKLYEGSLTVGTANFENGKIAVDFKSYTGKLLNDLLKKYSGDKINEDMLKRIPAKDVAAIFALNFKPEGINELLKMMGMDGLANIGISTMGFSLDDFIKANKGDILVAVTDIKTNPDTIHLQNDASAVVGKSAKPDFIFAASIGDKESFNKLIAAGKKLMGPKMVYSDSAAPDLSYNLNADYFAIGNSKEKVDKYIAGGNSNFDFMSKFSGNPFGGYINLQYIMKAMETEMTKDSSAKIAFDASMKMWDNVYMTGGKYADGGISYSMEINLVDKTSNSLKQLNLYLGKLSFLEKWRKDKQELSDLRMEEINKDEMTAPEAPTKEK